MKEDYSCLYPLTVHAAHRHGLCMRDRLTQPLCCALPQQHVAMQLQEHLCPLPLSEAGIKQQSEQQHVPRQALWLGFIHKQLQLLLCVAGLLAPCCCCCAEGMVVADGCKRVPGVVGAHLLMWTTWVVVDNSSRLPPCCCVAVAAGIKTRSWQPTYLEEACCCCCGGRTWFFRLRCCC